MQPEPMMGPQQRQKKITITILFWMFMVLLGVVFYKANNSPDEITAKRNYTEFERMLEEREIKNAFIALGQETARVYGTLVDNSEFDVTVPREATTDIIAKLREQGTPVTIEESNRDLKGIITTLAPLVLIAALWVFMIRTMRKSGGQSGSGGTGAQ